MKAFRTMAMPVVAGLMLAAAGVFAQNWSPPVAVTTGAGDDHNLAFGSDWYSMAGWVTWDRTDSGNTDIYWAMLGEAGGPFLNVQRLTTSPEPDVKPSPACDMLPSDGGIFYQGMNNDHWAIFYLARTETGFAAPWLTLYADKDLFDPQYSPIETDYAGAIPTLFLHSDSAAILFNYEWGGLWPEVQIPLDTSFYIQTPDSGYAVYSHSGFWTSSPPIGFSWMHLAWERQVEGYTDIECLYQITPESILTIITYQSLLPNDGYSYHHPSFDLWSNSLLLERESGGVWDIARSYIDPETGEWSLPEPVFVAPRSAKNPCGTGMMAFERDDQGSWDIGFYHPGLSELEFVDTDPAEDRNPVITNDLEHYHIYWESNRDGSWKIYHSQRDIVGVEPISLPSLLGNFRVSVHPNPGNAEFKIRLDLPVGGRVKAEIYDLSGRRVAELHNGALAQGTQSLTWNAAGKPSGIYLLRVESQTSVETSKVVLLK